MRNQNCGCGRSNCNQCCSNKGGSKPACCAANIPDSFFTDFLANIDACNPVGPNDPFSAAFAPDVLGIIGLILLPCTDCGFPDQLYGRDAVLANRTVFCGNTISRQHTLTRLQRFTFGQCDLLAVLDTDIVLEFAPGFGITGTQEIKVKFNEQCLIDTYVVSTTGTVGPIAAPGLARSAAASVDDPRVRAALRALGSRR